MRSLRTRPDLDQLRRQAKELLRAALAGDAAAGARLTTNGRPPTLASAQRALAAEYGYRNWAELKDAVERQREGQPSFLLRYTRTPDELRQLWDAITHIVGRPGREPPAHWNVFDDFASCRRRMLVVEHEDRIVGGTVAMKLIAIEPWTRGVGLGRRVWQTVEAETLAAGLPLSTHTSVEARGFFLALGYAARGKSKQLLYKGAPTARLADLRLARWRARVGDLEAGTVLTPDTVTGTIESVPW